MRSLDDIPNLLKLRTWNLFLVLFLVLLSSGCSQVDEQDASEETLLVTTTSTRATTSTPTLRPSPGPKPSATPSRTPMPRAYVATSLSEEMIRAQGSLTMIEGEKILESYTPHPAYPTELVPAWAWISAEIPEAYVDLDEGHQLKSEKSDMQLVIFGGSDTFFGFSISNDIGFLTFFTDQIVTKEDCLIALDTVVAQERLYNRNLFEEVSSTYTYCVITSDGRLSLVNLLDVGWTVDGTAFTTIDFTTWEEIVFYRNRPEE